MIDTEVYEWHDEDWLDIEDETDIDDSLSQDYDTEDDNDGRDNEFGTRQRPILWTEVRLDGEIWQVSSTGKYKKYDSLDLASEGIQLHGTPYRYATIANKRYFMHELVWHAFYGDPPDGWEVRHKSEYTSLRPRRVYSNHIANITIYPKVVSQQQRIDFG
jgi:hypothetical protein